MKVVPESDGCAVVKVRCTQVRRRKKRKTDGPVKKLTISGGYDEGDPPVPIPNTEVKPFSADGT